MSQETLVFLGLLCAALVFLLVLAQILGKKPELYPYVKQDGLFTPAERAFLQVLQQVVDGKQFMVFGKVRLADVIKPRDGLDNSARWSAFNKVSAKHLDFVICQAQDLAIVAAVELDDASHLQPERQARDAFVDAALAAAGVPILHVKVRRAYPLEELRAELARTLGTNNKKGKTKGK